MVHHGWTWELADMMRRVVRGPDFAGNLVEASEQIRKKGGRPPLLGLVAQALADEAKWKEVIWLLFCDDTRVGGSSESEGGGMALLEFGLLSEEYRGPIGRAAKEYLADPRVKQNRWHEAYHWLALLADEFVGLDKETIRGVILHGKPIGYSATTALIARLGEVPKGFSCDKAVRYLPVSRAEHVPKTRDIAEVVQQLKDYGRDSDELHPSLLGMLQECIFLPPLDEPTLASISLTGKPGTLISTALRFIYGMPPVLAETIPLLDRWMRIPFDERTKPHWKQLTKAWRILRGSALHDDRASAEAYLAALDRALLETEVWKLPIACEILDVRGSLADSQIQIVFSDYAAHATYLHEALFTRICDWLSGTQTDATTKLVVLVAENAIVTLNESPWTPRSGEPPNTWADLLFPTIQWAYGGKSSEASEAVFLRGVRGSFEELVDPRNRPAPNLPKLLAELDPLFTKVPPEILGNVVARGIGSLEPSVSAFCRLIHGFSKHCKRE